MKKSHTLILAGLIVTIVSFTGVDCSSSQTTGSGQVKNASTTATTSSSSISSNQDVNTELLKLAITQGSSDSKVTIIEASDVQCPACRSVHTEFAKVIDKYKNDVQFGYIPYPLSYHDKALDAAYAIEAAAMQGKGWEMHDKLFESEHYDEEGILAAAEDLGLNIDQFNADRTSDVVKQKITDAKSLLDQLGLAGTPTFYINGTEYQSSPTFANLSVQIEKMLVE